MIDKEKFIETFWEICDERDLYLYNITNQEIDLLLAETIDRVEGVEAKIREIMGDGQPLVKMREIER